MGKAERESAREGAKMVLADPAAYQLAALEAARMATDALDTADALAEDLHALWADADAHMPNRASTAQARADLDAYHGAGAKGATRQEATADVKFWKQHAGVYKEGLRLAREGIAGISAERDRLRELAEKMAGQLMVTHDGDGGAAMAAYREATKQEPAK